MADDQEPILIRQAVASLSAPNKTMKKEKKKSRGLLPFVSRLKCSAIIRALARSTARLRRTTKPSCRLSHGFSKLLESSSTCTSKRKPRVSSLHCSLIPVHLRRRNGHVPSLHHINDPLLGDPAHCPHTNDGAPNRSDTSRRITRGFHAKLQVASSHMEPPRKPKKQEADDHQQIKDQTQHRQTHMNGDLANTGPHKGGVPHDVPKGCVGLYVGEDHTRFVVPVLFLNHPLFASLLEGTPEIDGAFQPGALWIPCKVAEFQTLQYHMKHLSKNSL